MKNQQYFYTAFKFSLILSFIYVIIYNILFYDPILGYDAEAHYAYIDTLSRYLPRKIYIPNSNETREFFNPPLPYLFPSIIQVICRNFSSATNLLMSCKPVYGNISQIFQNIIYIFTIYVNLQTLKNFLNKKTFLNLSYLILIFLMAVNYRTVSMIRGEIYILFFMSLLLNIFLKVYKNSYNFSQKDVLIFGFIIGCLALSRQWAFLLFPPFFLIYYFDKRKKQLKSFKTKYFSFIASSLFIGFLISGWFYILSFLRYGTFLAFNMERHKNYNIESLANLLSLEGVSSYLFTNPIRPYFSNQFFPILYSDTWGDYWGYFSFTSRFLDIGRDQNNIGAYLGRVNFLSIFTTIFIVFGCYKVFKKYKKNDFINYVKYSIIFSLIGYFWFVFSYPVSNSGDTIKASYIIQMLNLMIFIGAIYLDEIRSKRNKTILIGILSFIYIYNFESYLSHFPINYPG